MKRGKSLQQIALIKLQRERANYKNVTQLNKSKEEFFVKPRKPMKTLTGEWQFKGHPKG